jgi:hypothetical protein
LGYRVKFRFKGIHHCPAVVFGCMDFRFWEELAEFIKQELKIPFFDFPLIPGAAKAIIQYQYADEIPLESIGISCDLHAAEIILVVNHADCGKYKGEISHDDIEAEQQYHELQLQKARAILERMYVGKQIILVYAKLVENDEFIEFIIVE